MVPTMPRRAKPAKPAPQAADTQKPFPKLYGLEKVAEMLDVSVTSVKRLIRTKQLKGFKVTSAWKVSEHDLWVYIRTARARGIQELPETPATLPPPPAVDTRQPDLPHTHAAEARAS